MQFILADEIVSFNGVKYVSISILHERRWYLPRKHRNTLGYDSGDIKAALHRHLSK
jgi:hypothetical protein